VTRLLRSLGIDRSPQSGIGGRDASNSRDTTLTLLTSTANLAAALIAGIVIARVLGPAGKGELARLVVFASLALDISAFGVAEAVVVFVAQRPESRLRLLSGLRRPTWLQGSLGVVVYSLCLFVAGVSLLQFPSIAFCLWVPAAIVMTRARSFLLGRGLLSAFNITRLLTEALPAVVIVLFWRLHLLSVATAGAAYLFGVLIAYMFARRVMLTDTQGPELSPSGTTRGSTHMGEFWSFARRNFISIVAAKGNANVDILLLGLLVVPAAAIGEYSVASTASLSIAFIGLSIGMVVITRVSNADQPSIAWSRLRSGLRFTVPLSAIAATLLWTAAPWIIPIIYGPAFSASADLVRTLVFGGFCISVSHVLANTLRGLKLPGQVAYAEGCGAVATALGIWIMGTDSLERVAMSATIGFTITLVVQTILVRLAFIRQRQRFGLRRGS
jgi:O-antigen/teichoic acid export membrane protein